MKNSNPVTAKMALGNWKPMELLEQQFRMYMSNLTSHKYMARRKTNDVLTAGSFLLFQSFMNCLKYVFNFGDVISPVFLCFCREESNLKTKHASMNCMNHF